MNSRIVALRLALVTLAGGLLSSPALACPPQIRVQRPGSTSDSAFVLVHASPGCQRGRLTVTGTAEGMVRGERRSIQLEVATAGADGVYRVRRQWPSGGVWVLRLVARVGEGSATALVGLNASGEVATVLEQDQYRRAIPVITDADVERMLRSLAS